MARSTKKKQGNGAPQGFEATLFQSADRLRRNTDAGEYKRVALGLLFLAARSLRASAATRTVSVRSSP